MQEWLNTENIAIIVLVAGNVAQWKQWTSDRKESREREIAMLTDAMDRDRGYTARMDESRDALRSVLRQQKAIRQQIESLHKLISIEASHLRLHVDPTSRPSPEES